MAILFTQHFSKRFLHLMIFLFLNSFLTITSSIHTLIGNSDMFIQGYFSINLHTQGMMYPGFYSM
jgi:hypothetical protein